MKKPVESWGSALAIEATQARQSFRHIIDEAYAAGRRVVVLRHGGPVAAIVSLKDFERLREHDRAADHRLAERIPTGEVSDPASMDGILAAVAHGEAGNIEGEDENWTFGDVHAEHLAADIVTQYVESPEFLQLARAQVAKYVVELAKGEETLSAADAAQVKNGILALLVKHGLGAKQYA